MLMVKYAACIMTDRFSVILFLFLPTVVWNGWTMFCYLYSVPAQPEADDCTSHVAQW